MMNSFARLLKITYMHNMKVCWCLRYAVVTLQSRKRYGGQYVNNVESTVAFTLPYLFDDCKYHRSLPF